MEDEIPPKSAGNLQDYEVACKEFTWASVDKEFDWSGFCVQHRLRSDRPSRP